MAPADRHGDRCCVINIVPVITMAPIVSWRTT